MRNFTRYFGMAVAALFFVLGIYLLASPNYRYLPKEVRVIFAVFLFLYGAFRIVRYIYKDREDDED
jgi:hypothetical protein